MSLINRLFLCVLIISSNLFSLELIHYKGDVYVNSKKLTGNKDVPLSKDDVVEAKGEGSVAVARYEDGSKVLVKNGQAILVEDGQVQRKWRLESGEVFVTVEKKKAKQASKVKKNRFMVLTKSAVMGVRGTKFYVQEGKDDSYMCVCEGEVEVSNKYGKVNVRKDSDIRLSRDTKNLKATQAPKKMIKMAWNGLTRLEKVEKDYISKRSSSSKKGDSKKKTETKEEAKKGEKREAMKGKADEGKRENLKKKMQDRSKNKRRSSDRGKVDNMKKRIQLSPEGRTGQKKVREARNKIKRAKRMKEKAYEMSPPKKLPPKPKPKAPKPGH